MTASRERDAAEAIAQIQELTRRHRELEQERIRAEEQQRAAAAELDQLEQRAIEQYGTADLAALEGQLVELRAANDRLCAEYEQHLAGIEERLEAVETAHAAATDEGEG